MSLTAACGIDLTPYKGKKLNEVVLETGKQHAC